MKVIDLLNKIANGEEVPKKIKYNNQIFEYYERLENTFNYKQIVNGKYIDAYFNDNYFIDNILNDEIEIIEEPKKIETLSGQVNIIQDDINPRIQDVMFENCLNDIVVKINEIIDLLNKGEQNGSNN